MEYLKREVRAIVFGALCKLGQGVSLNLQLRTKHGENLGIEIKLSRSIIKGQGEAFLKLLSEKKEVLLAAGAGFTW